MSDVKHKIVKINLNSIDKVKDFTSKIDTVACNCDIGRCRKDDNEPSVDAKYRYIVDAKSIMGIFSLDLTQPLDLIIHAEDDYQYQEVLAKIQPFIIEGVQ